MKRTCKYCKKYSTIETYDYMGTFIFCDCDESPRPIIIPDHIPKEQHKKYLSLLILKNEI